VIRRRWWSRPVEIQRESETADDDVSGLVGGMEEGIDGLWRVTVDVRMMQVRYTLSERGGERMSISSPTTSSSQCNQLSSYRLQFLVDSKSLSETLTLTGLGA
jgi:hypothetical protein